MAVRCACEEADGVVGFLGCASEFQARDNLLVSPPHGLGQRRLSPAVLGREERACVEQHAHCLQTALCRGDVQRRAAVVLHASDVCTLANELAQRVHLALCRSGAEQRRL